MTLVSSGQISIGGSGASNRSIEYELYSTTDQPIDILSADCRKLCGISTGAVKFSDFYSKSYPRLVSFTASPVKVVGGMIVQFTLTTSHVPDYTTFTFDTAAGPNTTTFTSSDIYPSSGSFQIIGDTYTGSVTISNFTLKPEESFHINVYQNGVLFATSPNIRIGASYTVSFMGYGYYAITVPDNVFSAHAIVQGGAGGSGGNDSYIGAYGYPGKQIYGDIQLIPGTMIDVYVGGGGERGYNGGSKRGGVGGSSLNYAYGGNGGMTGPHGGSGSGGGGGAASAVYYNDQTNVLVAGGGGGGGGGGQYSAGTLTYLKSASSPQPGPGNWWGGQGGNKPEGYYPGNDGGGGGGGGGGYWQGGYGGWASNGDNGAYSGQSGPNAVAAGFTETTGGSYTPANPSGGTGNSGADGKVILYYSVMPA